MNRAVRTQVAGGAILALLALVGVVVFSPSAVLNALVVLGERPLVFGLCLLAVYALRPLVLWPISALSLVVGFVLGLELGFPVALAGAVYTSLPPYFIARYAPDSAGPLATVRALGQRVTSVTGDLRGIVIARLLPLPADPVSYAAGVTGVSLPTFALATALGEFLWVGAAVLAGSSMRTFTVDGAGSTLPLIVAAAALGVLLLGGPLYRHLRSDSPTPDITR